jgi:hypothetical protein
VPRLFLSFARRAVRQLRLALDDVESNLLKV